MRMGRKVPPDSGWELCARKSGFQAWELCNHGRNISLCPIGQVPESGAGRLVPFLSTHGEGIDVDLFIYKQDKVKTIERIGRRIRLNRFQKSRMPPIPILILMISQSQINPDII